MKRFSGPSGLWQFSNRDGGFERRNVKKAGQQRGLYPDELEAGYLQRIDGEASVLLRNLIWSGPKAPQLSNDSRCLLSRWISLFALRIPKVMGDFENMVDAASKDPDQAIDVLNKNRKQVIEILEQTSPEAFSALKKDLGFDAAVEYAIFNFSIAVRAGRIKFTPDAKDCFGDFINTNRIENYAKRIRNRHWLWLRSDSDFIVGDNPLCRWHKNEQKWNYGIDRQGLEITIPINNRITLQIQKKQASEKYFIPIDRKRVRELNWRQLMSSYKYVYGSESSLRPMAKFCVEMAMKKRAIDSPPRHQP